MKQSYRNSKYTDSPNCSVVQIKEECIYVLGREIYNIANPVVDFKEGIARFYWKDKFYSLDQSPEADTTNEAYFPLNIAFEILSAFNDLDKILEDKLGALFRT